jgi:hypothetical protein
MNSNPDPPWHYSANVAIPMSVLKRDKDLSYLCNSKEVCLFPCILDFSDVPFTSILSGWVPGLIYVVASMYDVSNLSRTV